MSDLPFDDSIAATVLVVDDNEANLALARATLEDEDYHVLVASNGAEALAVFEASAVDCVLLDVRMPGQDGFSVCRALRALPAGADVPVLFLTALRDVETFDQAALAGGDDFLTKPVRPTELIARVRTALKLRRTGVELRGSLDALKQQRDALQRAQLAKERITAYVVHDLKNPVNVIDLHAQLLASDPDLSTSAQTSVAEIRAAARRLVRMITNLLDVSKGDEGKLSVSPTPVDVAKLFHAVRKELDMSASQAKVSLAQSTEVATMVADQELLRRALVNLGENAIRHAPPSSTVTFAAKRCADGIELSVTDAGPGVPVAQRASVFEPFVQLATGSGKNTGGRGLGLAFCKLVAEAHGGNIGVRDAAPGAEFHLAVPESHAS